MSEGSGSGKGLAIIIVTLLAVAAFVFGECSGNFAVDKFKESDYYRNNSPF